MAGFLIRSKPTVQHLSPTIRSRLFSTSRRCNIDFTHAVVGGGVVGLAVARELAGRDNTSTLLIERHGSVGTETSSRNSEVIHAGLYYGADSLKATLCIRGKHLLYELCKQHSIPHRRTKKWILAQDATQMDELEKLHKLATTVLDVPTRFLSRSEIAEREPDVRAEAGVLESESTGIIDSHALMAFLEADFLARGGETVFHTAVTRIEAIDPSDAARGYRIYTKPYSQHSQQSSFPTAAEGNNRGEQAGGEEEEDAIEVSTVINSAGLHAIPLSNTLLPPSRRLTPYYAKGTYFSYSPSSRNPRPKTLLYPAPVPGHAGLGTHLTLDMAGRVRFGPDVEWVDSPYDLTPHPHRLKEALDAIQTYLPSIDRTAVGLDYCGIRPKLSRGASGVSGGGGGGSGEENKKKKFEDFVVREEDGFGGFVNLLGIESPGLTSALAIAERVKGILYGMEK